MRKQMAGKTKREFRPDSIRGKINALYDALTTKKTLNEIIKERGFESDFKITKNHLKFLVNNLEFLPEVESKSGLTEEDKVKFKKSLGKGFLDLITLDEAQQVLNKALKSLKGEDKPKRQYNKKKKG